MNTHYNCNCFNYNQITIAFFQWYNSKIIKNSKINRNNSKQLMKYSLLFVVVIPDGYQIVVSVVFEIATSV